MAQPVFGVVYASQGSPAQLISVVPSDGGFRLVPANHYLDPEIRSEVNAIGLAGSAGNLRIFPYVNCSEVLPVNPIMIEDCESAPDLLSPQDLGPLSRDDDPRHEIDELQRALQAEKDKNKDLLRQKNKLLRQNRNLFNAQEREETRERRHQREAYEAERQEWVQQRESFDLLDREKEQAEALGRQLGSELAIAETTIKLLQQRQVPECPICREAVCCGVTQCGHQFCDLCFDLWYQAQGKIGLGHSCPTCRARLDDRNGDLFIIMHGIR